MTKRLKPREPRQKVFLVARARLGDRWIDARIWDVSERGMMLRIAGPAPEECEIEIARGPVLYRGRVVWAAGDRCGVRIEEPVDLEYLIGRTGRPARDALLSGLPDLAAHPPRAAAGAGPRLMEALRLASVSASRTRSSLTHQLAGTLQRVQASLER